MWLAGRAALCLLAIVLLSPSAHILKAQSYANSLSIDSVDPQADSSFIREARKRIDQIRRDEQRPTIALVLSGGGAKGAAQVGALKYLEEIGMPIDMICGTSIGGLLGGLYSIGYRADELRELFVSQDWDTTLTDKVAPSFLPYATKMYKTKYLVSIPFGSPEGLMNLRGEERNTTESILSSLPAGYAYGFNVSKLLSSLTVGYQGERSFIDFPIPFVCVASDIVSCKAKNWGYGELSTAMRSTMSIPGLFSPVRSKDMVLVDGGTRNNFPADIARATGVDYIIGINLSDGRSDYQDVNNIGTVMMQFITMLGNDAYDKNIDIPDVMIQPNVQGYNMLSFNQEAIDTLIMRGYKAAQSQSKSLGKLKAQAGQKAASTQAKAIDISKTAIRLHSISFDGLDNEESKLMFRLIGDLKTGLINKDKLDIIMSRLQASGLFSTIKYSILGESSPYDLVFHCTKAPAHSIGFGFRIDTEEWASLLMNIDINQHHLSGSRLSLSTKLGPNLKANLHYAYVPIAFPTINVDVSFSNSKGTFGSFSQPSFYDLPNISHEESIYLTDIRWTKYNFKLGVRNRYTHLDQKSYLIHEVVSDRLTLQGDYIGLFAGGHYYSLDDYYYPNKGTSIKFDVNYDFAQIDNPKFAPIFHFGMSYKQVFPLNNKFTIISDLHLQDINTQNSSSPSILHHNIIGGAIEARYHNCQVPFFGLTNSYIAEDNMLSLSAELRYNPRKKLYVSALAGLISTDASFFNMCKLSGTVIYAAGTELGFQSIAGPIKLNAHWNSHNGMEMYVSFGLDF